MIMNPLEDKSQYVLFPDFSKVIEQNISTDPWTAPENCWIGGRAAGDIYINEALAVTHPYLNYTTYFVIPVKKGDVITNISKYDDVSAYKMRR